MVNAYVLTEKQALHMRAIRTFTDDFGVIRKNGEEWLIKMTDTETHIPGVYEQVRFIFLSHLAWSGLSSCCRPVFVYWVANTYLRLVLLQLCEGRTALLSVGFPRAVLLED